MSENIEIKITDKVALSVSDKLRNIAASARAADSAVKNLQQQLNSINTGSLNVILNSASQATRALQQTSVAAQRLATEQQRTATAAAQAAQAQARAATAATQSQTAAQNLATATERANAAQSKSATAAQQLATEQQRTAIQTANAAAAADRAAIAALRLQQAQERQARAMGDLNREGEQLKRTLFPLYEAHERYNEQVARARLLHKEGAIDAQTYAAAISSAKEKLENTAASIQTFDRAQTAMGKNAKINRAHLANLSFQLNDIGVSLASGQNPLIVLIQQGSQIAGIASQAGVGLGRLAAEAGKMLLRFVPLVAAFGAAYAALQLFQSEAEKSAGLKEYAKQLGATDKEIEKLNLDTLTFGDTMKGLWRTIDQLTGLGDRLSKMWAAVKTAFSNILKLIATAASSIQSYFEAIFKTTIALWQTLPKQVMYYFTLAVNEAMGGFETFVNTIIKGINTVIEGINKVSKSKIDLAPEFKFERLNAEQFKPKGENFAEVFTSSFKGAMQRNQKSVSDFMKKWQDNSVKAAKERIAKELGETKSAEKRSAVMEKINAQLDNELNRMFKLRPEREAQARFDQIEEQLLGKKIKLNEAESASIMAKIKAIQANVEVQKQFDAIYDEVTKAQIEHNASLKAAEMLLKQGAISQQQYLGIVAASAEAYKAASDPLYKINKDLEEQNRLLQMLPKQREIEQQIIQAQNEALQQKHVLTQQEITDLRQKLELQQQLNEVSQAEAALMQDSVLRREQAQTQITAAGNLMQNPQSGFKKSDAISAMQGTEAGQFLEGSPEAMQAEVDRLEENYALIDQMRQKDLISEQTAAAAKVKIWNEQQKSQLKVAQTFFGSLEALQTSQNSKMARIGKAAAIANAIINTYQSATAAYAAMAGIPVIGPGLGAAAAGAAIVAGMANVAAIRSQNTGFMAGGYTGNIPRNQVAGDVHGQEFVMNAAATQRIGVDNLEALQRGAANVQKPKPTAQQPQAQHQAPKQEFKATIINVRDEAELANYLQTEPGTRVVFNVLKNNPDELKNIVQNA